MNTLLTWPSDKHQPTRQFTIPASDDDNTKLNADRNTNKNVTIKLKIKKNKKHQTRDKQSEYLT